MSSAEHSIFLTTKIDVYDIVSKNKWNMFDAYF